MRLVAGSDTHFGVRYLDSKNVFQSTGVADGNKSHGSVLDAGVTHKVGFAEVYAGYTKFGDLSLNTPYNVDDGVRDTGDITTAEILNGPSGFIIGVGYKY